MKNEIAFSIINILESFFSSIILLGKIIVIVVGLFILLIINNFFSGQGNSDNSNKLKKFIRDNVGTTDDYD